MSQLLHDSKIIPMNQIIADERWNCRGTIPMADIITLKAEIARDGLLQPVVVRPLNGKYGLVAGFRRFKACQALNFQEISTVVKEGLNDLQARALNMIENIERKQLNILQEAHGIASFKRAGWTQQATAKELNQSSGWVAVRWQLLEMEPEIQECAAAGLLTQDNIKTLCNLPPGYMRFDAVKKIKEARARGEKAQIDQVMRLGKRRNPLRRQPRKPQEIFLLIENIAEFVGFGLATRFGAWCAGEISDVDLLRDIKKAAEESDPAVKYKPPDHLCHIRLT